MSTQRNEKKFIRSNSLYALNGEQNLRLRYSGSGNLGITTTGAFKDHIYSNESTENKPLTSSSLHFTHLLQLARQNLKHINHS